ncbi:MAG: PAS domain S-box protein [Richelia sp. SL_2_1]|nr:PAS domain S-box protein [Richelia sp. SM1_7_0]NJO28302.1 PAS domain S-box protein [Richelia sp. SL_2_1]
MIKASSIKKLRIVFLLALCVIFANTVILCTNTINLKINQRNVNHSHQVIIQLERILSGLKDVQINNYRYFISADVNYLKSDVSARQKIDIDIQLLKDLIKDNYQEQRQFIVIVQNITNQLDLLRKELYLSQNKTLDLSSKITLINEIKSLTKSIENTEQNLLLNQLNRSQKSFARAIAIFSIAGLINLGLVTKMYYLLKDYILRLQNTKIALRQSENRLRAIIDAEPECIKLIDQNGILLEINASGVAMMEVESADILIGKLVYSAIMPEYQNAFKLMHESVCRGNKESLEFEMIGFKNTRRWMETHAVPLPSENNNRFLHLAITRDITQRKLAEQKLREQAALLDVVTNAILVKDIDNRILYWNKGAENIYGWKASEVHGQKASQLLHKEYSSWQDDALLSVINTGKWQGELHQITKEGKDIIIESRWTLLRDEKGKPKSILAENTEITQKKQLETQLLRTQRLESIGTLAGGIAHDLNNVLAPILMSVQLLERKLQDSQHLRLLKTLENNTQRGASLIKQLLSFARGIEGKRTLVQVKNLIVEIEQIVRETFPKSIQLTVNIPQQLGYVWGDDTQLHQVLINLVVNARDAMPTGGKLEISAANLFIDQHHAQINIDAKIGAYIVITIADTGIGIHPQVQERIFEPFFTTKEQGKGTGLGLSTALGIIKNHGGFVNVDSELNKGTIVKVYLPIKPNPNTDIPHGDRSSNLNGSGELILVVDDEPAICQITQSSLEAYNYRVLTASNGMEAVEIYAKYQREINVVLLDMMMPEMDGETTIKMLKKINPQVKIVAISGLVLNSSIEQVSNQGVEAFMSKPCTGKELLHTLVQVTREFS